MKCYRLQNRIGFQQASTHNLQTLKYPFMRIIHIVAKHYDLILTRLARTGATSLNEIQPIKHYSILISIEHSRMNQAKTHY